MDEIQTKRSRKLLEDGGYLFTFHKQSADRSKKFWRCQGRSDGCKARLHTDINDVVASRTGLHTHGSNAARVEVARVKTAMRKRAVETMEPPSLILNNVIQGLDQATMGQMPNKDATRKIIGRARIKNAKAPPMPTSLADLITPEEYQTYKTPEGNSELFLLGDNGPDAPNRILVFGRASFAAWSDQMKDVYMDGTFNLAPPLFEQVYAILSKRANFVFPIIYALLPNKQQCTYEALFTLIKEIWPQFHPDSVSVDFEKAVINAVGQAFPNAEVRGCLYHLMKNFRRHLADAKMLQRYNTEPAFSLNARMIVSLAFVPITGLDEAFQALSETLSDDLGPMLTWFEEYYLGRRVGRNRRRRDPPFSPALWNVYDRVIEKEDRTNNHAEAAHRRLQTEFNIQHPSIWRFIDGLRQIQKGRDLVYEQYVRGERAPRKRQKYQDADERILNIVSTYADRPIIEYLRGLAHNFLME